MIDAFHVVGDGDVGIRFFHDERKRPCGASAPPTTCYSWPPRPPPRLHRRSKPSPGDQLVGSYRFFDEITDAVAAMENGLDVTPLITHRYPINEPADPSGPGIDYSDEPYNPFGPPVRPDEGMVTLQRAVEIQGDMRRRAAADARARGHATVRPAQRALPRGKPS